MTAEIRLQLWLLTSHGYFYSILKVTGNHISCSAQGPQGSNELVQLASSGCVRSSASRKPLVLIKSLVPGQPNSCLNSFSFHSSSSPIHSLSGNKVISPHHLPVSGLKVPWLLHRTWNEICGTPCGTVSTSVKVPSDHHHLATPSPVYFLPFESACPELYAVTCCRTFGHRDCFSGVTLSNSTCGQSYWPLGSQLPRGDIFQPISQHPHSYHTFLHPIPGYLSAQ